MYGAWYKHIRVNSNVGIYGVGDVLYVPAGAWHAAYNEETTVSVFEPYVTAENLPQVSV